MALYENSDKIVDNCVINVLWTRAEGYSPAMNALQKVSK